MNVDPKIEDKPLPVGAGASAQPPNDGDAAPAPTPEEAAAAAAAAAAEVLAAKEARRQREDAVLAAAGEIRQRRAAQRPWPEPKPVKSHWDHLLNEMAWLAKEFARERGWKIKTAKKYATAVSRSNLDLESRVEARAKEEEKTIRRRAAWIAREVAAFWDKAQRVVAFKARTEADARKKVVLDRQLDILLGQTQKYSAMLAQRLSAEEQAEAVARASAAEAAVAPPQPAAEPVAEAAALTGPAGAVARQAGVAAEPPSVAVSGTAYADDAMDYRSGEDDEADDEATLEEEEARAQAEGEDLKKTAEAELEGLEDDADLPIDQLLARYGYVVPTEGQLPPPAAAAKVEEEEDGSGAGPSSRPVAAAADEGSDAESERLDALLADMGAGPEGTAAPGRASMLAAEFATLSEGEGEVTDVEEEAAGPSSAAARRTRRAAIGAAGERDSGAGGDEDEYRSGEDDEADDEATLEEEEAKAQAELGQEYKKVEAAELEGLEGDADLPLEELLARYGYVNPETADATHVGEGPQGAAAGAATGADTSAAAGPTGSGLGGAEVEAGGEQPVDINDTMAAMVAAQPTGHTLDTARVKTPVPFLLKGQLREYQHIGMDWLVTLYHKRLNGILADEMGLGKTIQTIALLAWLACERGDWGPHLVVVPTSVMLNWEMEFKRWCPAFKLLTYYGGVKERAAKRQGWSKPNAFHVCITSYTLVLQDARMFKRKKWKYLILDEAHMIKNWRSQRWQTLLNFNSKRRLLITGTPLQNDLMELWSLMHFLMPQVFGSHAQFKDWFSNPMTGMVEGSAEYNKAVVDRLHAVLRPFLLRRLKRDVEKQLPGKHEHVVYCRLSKRQRQLYEEYMASGDTRATLASGNFLGIINCLMQLRKVCNHPDLFEGRPIVSAFDMAPLELKMPSAAVGLAGGSRREVGTVRSGARSGLEALATGPDLAALGLLPVAAAARETAWARAEVAALALAAAAFAQPATTPQQDVELLLGAGGAGGRSLLTALARRAPPSREALTAVAAAVQALVTRRRLWRQERTAGAGRLSVVRAAGAGGLSVAADFPDVAHVEQAAGEVHVIAGQQSRHLDFSDALRDMVKLPERRAAEMEQLLRSFVVVIPKARAPAPALVCSHPDASAVVAAAHAAREMQATYASRGGLLHVQRQRSQLFFPDRRLLQYDCGKLQELAALLHRLKPGGHRALIFTQMSKMLDVLEAFLNLNGHTYVRLDGATKPEQRQFLMQRFNSDPRIFCFILSTRSGGVGMNLTGADTVVFYDSDWNPAMDAQAQDRCHRIGQTREVHIYRLVTQHTIEENILKKSDQKRQLDYLAIQSGGFTTEFLQKFDPKAIMGLEAGAAGAGGGVLAAAGPSAAAAAAVAVPAAGEPSGAAPSEEAIRAAMRAAEDEGDAEAAVAVEREAAAEMDEFTKEPPAVVGALGAGAGDGGEEGGAVPGEGEEATEPPSQPPEPDAGAGAVEAGAGGEDGGMAELAALAGGKEGGDAVAQLESALRPIERYAVRFVEVAAPGVDSAALAAQVEAQYHVDEFDVDAIEAAEEEREAEIDEDEEANMVADWDQAAANQAYAVQVAEAEQEERAREEAEAAWLAQYGLQYGLVDVSGSALAEPSGTATSKGRGGRGGGGSRPSGGLALGGGEDADTAMSPRLGAALGADAAALKRRRTASGGFLDGFGPAGGEARPVPLPWEPPEDLVLCSMVALLLERGELPGVGLFGAVSSALAAGVAASSVTGVGAAARQGARRTPLACAQRYAQLRAAYEAAGGAGEAPTGKENVAAGLTAVRRRLVGVLHPAYMPRHALGALYHTLTRAAADAHTGAAPCAARAAALLRTLHGLCGEVDPATPPVDAAALALMEMPPPPPGVAPAGPLSQAQAMAAAVRSGCGSGAARVISTRLPGIVDAAQVGGREGGPFRPADGHRSGMASPRSPLALPQLPAAGSPLPAPVQWQGQPYPSQQQQQQNGVPAQTHPHT